MLAALIAAELGAYLLCGFWLASALRLPPLWAVVLMVAFVLAARLGVVTASFALSHPYRRHADGSLLGKLRVFWIEFLIFTALFTLLQPLERWLMRGKIAGDAGSLPVLMIPGIYCNAAVWWWMRRRLSGSGLRTVAINLEPPLASIDDFAEQLAEHIERVCADTGAEQVVLLGHSMGGIVARAYLKRFGDRGRVTKLIALAAPHHGSELARLAIGADGRQLRRGNPWLARLNETEREPSPVPLVSLFTWQDNFVAPQHSSMLAHATNVALEGMGHFSLLFSGEVAQRVHEEIVGIKNGTRA
jgi:pimeloyl-ACP methyl ester carboxylesterase